MEGVGGCGCKGIRTCLICEEEYSIAKPNVIRDLKKAACYVYCPLCDKAWPGWDTRLNESHPYHRGEPVSYPGVYIKEHFLGPEEEESLLKDLDALPWDISQSGRRKQNYGPKCNFKKRRLRLGDFAGFPCRTKFVQERLSKHEILKDFQTIEQCSLEYTPERGSSIDPHIDDCWIWGERIVTVNVLADSVLTMTKYKGSQARYNLTDVCTYPSVVKLDQSRFEKLRKAPEDAVVRLPMPVGSLIVLYGAARYEWEHAVLREDVHSRRVCIAYREFTPTYLPGGNNFSSEARRISERAFNFF